MAIWYDAIKEVVNEIKAIIKKKEAKQQLLCEALEGVEDAANETSIYMQQCMRKVELPNKELKDLWKNAATKVRQLNPDLYMRCMAKAEFWSNPASWTQDQISNANIALESIQKDTREALKEVVKK